MRNLQLEKQALRLTPPDPCHDFSHTLRVMELAQYIAEIEGGNQEIIYLAALLHDIGRSFKESDRSHAIVGAELAEEILHEFDYPEDIITEVTRAIAAHSKKAGVYCESLEAKILYDADKVDAFGAIGLARLFADGTSRNIPFYKYSAEIEKDMCSNIMEYDQQIIDGLYTPTARKMCEERLQFQRLFFQQMAKEIGRKI